MSPAVHFFFKTFFGASYQFIVSGEVENLCFEALKRKKPIGLSLELHCTCEFTCGKQTSLHYSAFLSKSIS